MPQKPYRDRRLGSQSLELIFGAASSHKKLKISHIYLHVQTSNGEAKRFYERHGFKEIGQVILSSTWGWNSTNVTVSMKIITRRSGLAMLGSFRESSRVERLRSRSRMSCQCWRILDSKVSNACHQKARVLINVHVGWLQWVYKSIFSKRPNLHRTNEE